MKKTHMAICTYDQIIVVYVYTKHTNIYGVYSETKETFESCTTNLDTSSMGWGRGVMPRQNKTELKVFVRVQTERTQRGFQLAMHHSASILVVVVAKKGPPA
jgi:hypothetical protein